MKQTEVQGDATDQSNRLPYLNRQLNDLGTNQHHDIHINRQTPNALR